MAPGSRTTVTIGVDLPLSGAEAASGMAAEEGARLAVEQENARAERRYTYRLQVLDDAVNGLHDPAKGAKNVAQLVGDASVVGVVGPLHGSVAEAEIPLTNEASLAQISPGATAASLTGPDLRRAHPDQVAFFRVCTTAEAEGSAAADYASKTLGERAAFVLDDQEVDGVGEAEAFARRFAEDGGKVLGREHLGKGQRDFGALLAKVRAARADVAFYGGAAATGGGLLRKQMGTGLPFLGVGSLANAGFLAEAGSAASGAAAAVPFAVPSDWMAGQSPYRAATYDAASILIQAAETAGASRQAVRTSVAGLKDYHGLLGVYGFDQTGDTTSKATSLWRVGPAGWAPAR